MPRSLSILLFAVATALLGCARGGSISAPGPGGGITPPSAAPDPPFLSGLVAVAAGSGTVRLDVLLVDPGLEAAVFQSMNGANVYDGAPILEGIASGPTTIGGLTDGDTYFFGLGVRMAGTSDYIPTGTVLRARPDAPIYVDASASAVGADGMTPATAFPQPLSAVLTAFAQGGGNIWIRDGRYGGATLPVRAGTHIYGGFDETFTLAARDVAARATVFDGEFDERLFDLQGGEPAIVLDGLRIAGAGLTTVGVDSTDTALEMRSVHIEQCLDRGIRLRNSSSTDCLDVVIASSTSQQNGADGLSATGAFDLRIDGSSFDANAQEGVEIDDLVALEGGGATLVVTGCRFLGNATEGLDADLAAPVIPGPGGGTFTIRVRGCRFELNGTAGLLIDQDYELTPGWEGTIAVEDSTARANGTSGIQIDADSVADILFRGVTATANAGDGIWISSESEPGLAVVTTSIVSGNLGAGMRASLGNQPIAASHCVFAGNVQGGLISEVLDSSAASCIAYLQDDPWFGTRRVACVEVTTLSPPTFALAPEAFVQVVAQAGDMLTLARADVVTPGASVELADDQERLIAVQASGTALVVDEEPEQFAAPGMLAVFAPGADVAEDYRIPAGSPAEGAGMTPPGGPIVDAGPWGAPSVTAPGAPDGLAEEPFALADVTPPLSAGVGPFDTIDLRFSQDIDLASATADQVRAVVPPATELPISFMVVDDTIHVMPPGGGWGASSFFLEVHADLRAQGGAPLSTPTALYLVR